MKMEILGSYSYETLQGFIRPHAQPILLHDVKISLSASRLQTLARSPVCAKCGIVGTVWRLERHHELRRSTEGWHINLYAQRSKGDWLLMNRDHIYPKSKGGCNCLFNSQTMCERCNRAKKDDLPDIDPRLGTPHSSVIHFMATGSYKEREDDMRSHVHWDMGGNGPICGSTFSNQGQTQVKEKVSCPICRFWVVDDDNGARQDAATEVC